MIFGLETDATLMPTRRGPVLRRLADASLAVASALGEMKHHSTRSPGWICVPEVLRMVAMPPIDTVKNSSTLGPTPSSGVRTLFDRATPAKK